MMLETLVMMILLLMIFITQMHILGVFKGKRTYRFRPMKKTICWSFKTSQGSSFGGGSPRPPDGGPWVHLCCNNLLVSRANWPSCRLIKPQCLCFEKLSIEKKHSWKMNMYVCNTLTPKDYDSFAMVMLNQNHRGIDIAELILVSLKVIITCTKEFSQ